MDWIHVSTIIGFLVVFMFFIFQRLEKDIDKINKNLDRVDRRLDGHGFRIAQLYKMFVDLLKKKNE